MKIFQTRRGALRLTAAALAISLGATGAMAQTKGGTLNTIVQPEPPLLVLGLNQQSPTQYVASKIYEGLLTYDPDLAPQPGLAKSWETSEDGLTYTFTLQDGVTWHDGEKFSSADVVFSVDKYLRQVHPRVRPILNTYLESVTAPDDQTVVFKLKSPFAPFIQLFGTDNMTIVPAHIYEGTEFATNPQNQHPIGTGPFMFESWERGSAITLVKNPNYWKDGLPYLDKIVFSIIPDSASRAVAFEQGQIDVLRGTDVDPVDVSRLENLDGVEETTKGTEMYSTITSMIMNERELPFSNKQVRQAISYALDRDFMVQTIFFGIGKPATGPISSTLPFYDGDVPKYDYDLDKARELIKESGVDLSAHPVKILDYPYGSTWARLAEYVSQQLKQIGFTVDIEATDAGGWAQRVGNFDFDTTFHFSDQFGDPAIGVSRLFVTSNIVKGSPFANNAGYSNPEVDEIFAKAASSTSREDRQELYTEAQKILVDDAANIYLFENQNVTLYKDSVHNLITSGVGTNSNFETVYIDDAK
ncbi:ABC transporter substrate-binding protein [Alloyangia pacifica]|uniref:Peptide/nickel transport system substrate-binding protein n=1 Tax=Alloyangia pacifica TaxID=311180 RepID=A0A1I6VH69_9RHOB|nr:ABC transporter substrate-binding protein [Alloyangia pacifica]SDH98026.1 peptide/nickel transport system substrate-binding protein [Alloyangia pacifica]SFT13063.1 peptide/nickel transport system substrate-binding protein [Alloyangia pacifica]